MPAWQGLLAALKTRALEHKDTVRIGRSHGIHAEPTTMGLTFARFYAEMDRNLARLQTAREEIATGAISGAVGTFANIDPRRRGTCLRQAGPAARTDLHPGHSARPPRHVLSQRLA